MSDEDAVAIREIWLTFDKDQGRCAARLDWLLERWPEFYQAQMCASSDGPYLCPACISDYAARVGHAEGVIL